MKQWINQIAIVHHSFLELSHSDGQSLRACTSGFRIGGYFPSHISVFFFIKCDIILWLGLYKRFQNQNNLGIVSFSLFFKEETFYESR